MKTVVLGVLLVVGISGAARAQIMSGNELHEYCSQYSGYGMGFCTGFIFGIAQARDKIDICTPDGVLSGQVRDVVVMYLRNNPVVRHQSAYELAKDVLTKTWPCR